MSSATSEGKRVIAIAIDGSKQAEVAFKCKLSFLFSLKNPPNSVLAQCGSYFVSCQNFSSHFLKTRLCFINLR